MLYRQLIQDNNINDINYVLDYYANQKEKK